MLARCYECKVEIDVHPITLLCGECQSEKIKEKEKEKEDMVKCKNCGLEYNINICHICEREDIINKPNHYHETGVDPISIGESILTKEEMNGFYKMNMIKYWHRAGKKDGSSKEQDLKKYEFYKKKLEGGN